jgi:hypothetical protein
MNGADSEAPVDTIELSQEFVAGNTKEGLEKIRRRLLDLTGRNRLLNYRHRPASCLRIVDLELACVFESLLDGQRMLFEPVPEPEERDFVRPIGGGAPQKPNPEQHAKSLGWNTSYDLAEVDTSHGSLRVLHYLDRLEPILRRMESKARTIIEESGTNMLYLVLGFLEWFESEDSDESHLAPLLMVPVNLERPRSRDIAFDVAVRHSGEDIESNLSLAERLTQDFGLTMPFLEEDELPEAYFSRFTPLLTLKRRWKLHRHLTLTFLSFGKLLMYRDLDPKSWPANGLLQHRLVRELFEGTKRSESVHAEEYAIDEPELEGRIPVLIQDADSSQHSALVDALEGKNLVIEGPPGTGKSQTITNLIAVALAQGKTVLFVAEKLAALEVVRTRLDKTGLGIFCLELHSHKAKWDKLIPDLEQRLERRHRFDDAADLDAKRKLLSEKKRFLNEYARLINSCHDPLGRSVFDILWARERYLKELRIDSAPLTHILLPFAPTCSQEDLGRAEQCVEVYSWHLKNVLAGRETLGDHPWAWVASASLTFVEESRLLQSLRSLAELAGSGERVAKWLSEEPGFEVKDDPQGLAEVSEFLLSLPTGNEIAAPSLLRPCRSPDVRRALASLARSIEEAKHEIGRIQSYLTEKALWDSNVKQSLAESLRKVQDIGLSGNTIPEIRGVLESAKEVEGDLKCGLRGCQELAGWLSIDSPSSLRTLRFAYKCVDLIDGAPLEHLHLRTEGMTEENAKAIIQGAAAEATELLRLRLELAQHFNLELLEEPVVLLRHAEALANASIWNRIFGSRYKAAKLVHRGVSKRKRKRLDMAADLRELAQYQRKARMFSERSDLKALLGINFRGVESDWPSLVEVANWYQRVCVALPPVLPESEPFRAVLFNSPKEQLKAIMERLDGRRNDLEQVRQSLVRAEKTLPILQRFVDVRDTTLLTAILDALGSLVSSLRLCLESFNRAHLLDTVTDVQIAILMSAADQVEQAMAALDSNDQARAVLGLLYRGMETNLEPVKGSLKLAEAFDHEKFPRRAVSWLLCEEYPWRLQELKRQLEASGRIAQALAEECRAVSELSGSAKGYELYSTGLRGIAARAREQIERHEELPQWLQYLRWVRQAKEWGLAEVTALADAGTLRPDELLPSFRFVFFNSLARAIFESHPELSQFTGITQEELRRQFASLDREIIRLNPQRLAHMIDRRYVPQGRSTGPVGQWTDLALVKHEISKQRRHIPIRQLMVRAGQALQNLKPCFMMGPLSVAQYLAAGKLTFDLIVMDEASQLRPEDAIGAVTRGGQLIVVGDPKQLPPTNFFQRMAIDEDEEDDTKGVVEEGESILDVATALYQPVRRLRWHYRSRHHSLIAFSNREFYQGRLIVFPSAYEQKEDLGVRYRQVTNGIFENRRNAPEAEAIVEAILEHMHVHADESLGVVALNLEQRELIEELFDKRLRQEVFAEAYAERFDEGSEPFFIKNLENVQGDERDVIFVSCTYGPDSRGNQYQRFGPINGPNGPRRLNVLFTRAKKRVEVFSSLDPDKIEVGQSAEGLRVLKGWLHFARSGTLEQTKFCAERPTNDFESSVAAILTQSGHQVVSRVLSASLRDST